MSDVKLVRVSVSREVDGVVTASVYHVDFTGDEVSFTTHATARMASRDFAVALAVARYRGARAYRRAQAGAV